MEKFQKIDKLKRIWKPSIRTVIILVLSVALFFVFFIEIRKNISESNKNLAPNVVIMGDSIFANGSGLETSVENLLGEMLDTEIIDISLGGTTLAYADTEGRLDATYDAFCMSALTKAILSDDFRYQENADLRAESRYYFAERIELLKQIDFSQVDILIFNHMVNDYQSVVEPDYEDGTSNYGEMYTYSGALKNVITQLKDEYPNLDIYLVSAPETWYEDFGSGEYVSSSLNDFGEGNIFEYIDIQEKVAEEMGVKFIYMWDVYEKYEDEHPECLVSEDGELLERYEVFTWDAIHPNELGRLLIAKRIAEYISIND